MLDSKYLCKIWWTVRCIEATHINSTAPVMPELSPEIRKHIYIDRLTIQFEFERIYSGRRVWKTLECRGDHETPTTAR